MPNNSLAATATPEIGDTITVTFTREGGPPTFTYGSGDDAFEGPCIQMGTQGKSGSATVQQPTLRMKKIAYYYGVKLGYWDDNSSGSAKDLIGVSSTGMSKAGLVEHLLQIENQGASEWRSICVNGNYLLAANCDGVLRFREEIDFDSIEVPSNFEMFKLDCGSNQDGAIWRMVKKGQFKLKKSSSNTLITG